ncbi:MAG: hypothetical protein AAFU38_20395 [Bacteroidota bacterium]
MSGHVPLHVLIESYFAPTPAFSSEQEEEHYDAGMDDLHEEIVRRLAGGEGRAMRHAADVRHAARDLYFDEPDARARFRDAYAAATDVRLVRRRVRRKRKDIETAPGSQGA